MGASSSTAHGADASGAASVTAEEVMSEDSLRSHEWSATPASPARLPIIYAPEYDIRFYGLEKWHPYDTCKSGRIVSSLSADHHIVRGAEELHRPLEVPHAVLRLVHDEATLQLLNSSAHVAGIIEMPPLKYLSISTLQKYVLKPMRFGVGGTILAADLAMRKQTATGNSEETEQSQEGAEEQKSENPGDAAASASSSGSAAASSIPRVAASASVSSGWSINLGGGFHHCSARSAGGFCAYADITLALVILAKKFSLKRAMIVDLDAHQGNGHANDKRNGVFERAGVEVFILDMFNETIYPQDHAAKAAIDCAVPLQSGTADEEYLGLLRRHLTQSLDTFRPEFIIYNAGTDCLDGDALGKLRVSKSGIIARDEFVWRSARERDIPITMLLSGGYLKTNATIIAESIANLRGELDLWEVANETSTAAKTKTKALCGKKEKK